MGKRYVAGPLDDGGYALWCLEIENGSEHMRVRCSGTVVGTLPYRDDDTDEQLGKMLEQFVHLLEQVSA